jgi:hypothetical protein
MKNLKNLSLSSGITLGIMIVAMLGYKTIPEGNTLHRLMQVIG